MASYNAVIFRVGGRILLIVLRCRPVCIASWRVLGQPGAGRVVARRDGEKQDSWCYLGRRRDVRFPAGCGIARRLGT